MVEFQENGDGQVEGDVDNRAFVEELKSQLPDQDEAPRFDPSETYRLADPDSSLDRLREAPRRTGGEGSVGEFPYRSAEIEANPVDGPKAAMMATNLLNATANTLAEDQRYLAYKELSAVSRAVFDANNPGRGLFNRNRFDQSKYNDESVHSNVTGASVRLDKDGEGDEATMVRIFGQSHAKGRPTSSEGDSRPTDFGSRGIVVVDAPSGQQKYYWETSNVEAGTQVYSFDAEGKPVVAGAEQAQQLIGVIEQAAGVPQPGEVEPSPEQ